MSSSIARQSAFSIAAASALFAAGVSVSYRYVMKPSSGKDISDSEDSPDPVVDEVPDTVASEGSISSDDKSIDDDDDDDQSFGDYNEDSFQATYPSEIEDETNVESPIEMSDEGAMTVQTVVEVAEEVAEEVAISEEVSVESIEAVEEVAEEVAEEVERVMTSLSASKRVIRATPRSSTNEDAIRPDFLSCQLQQPSHRKRLRGLVLSCFACQCMLRRPQDSTHPLCYHI